MKKLNIKQLFPYLSTVFILLLFVIFRVSGILIPLFVFIALGCLGYLGYVYAQKKGYSVIFGLILSIMLNFIGLAIIFLLPNKNKEHNKKAIIYRVNRLNRIKFYFYLLVFTVGVFFLGILFIKLFGTCEGMECLAIAPFLIGLVVILLTVIIIINLRLIITYEKINKENKKNRRIILVYILIIFASASYGIFGDLFFLNSFFNRINNVKLEHTTDSFVKNKDIVGCLLYVNKLSSDKYSGPDKTILRNKCALEIALAYKDLSACQHYFWDYDYTYLGYCYTEVLSSMHKKPDMTVYNTYFNQAELFCESLQNDRPLCLFIISNPTFYILNNQEMLSFCQSIDDSETQFKCVNRYSPVSQQETLSFCDSIDESAKMVCIERLTRLVNFRRDYLEE